MHRYRKLLQYAKRQWRWLAAIFILTLISSATSALQPWPMKLLVDFALGDKPLPEWATQGINALGGSPTPIVMVGVASGFGLVLFAIHSVLSAALGLCWSVGGQRMVYDLAGDLFERFQRLSLRFHSRQSVGDSLSRLSEDTWCVYSVTDGLLMSPLRQVFTLGLLAVISFNLDPLLACISLGIAPLLGGSAAYFGKRLKHRAKIGREARSRLMSFVHQTLGAIPVVQAFGQEGRNRDRFQHLASDIVVQSQRGQLINSSFGSINGLITTLGMAAVLSIGGMRVMNGAIPLGTLLVFLAYVRQMQDASKGLFQTYAQLKAAEASIDRIMEIVESEEVEEEDPDARPYTRSNLDRAISIRFENVSYGYDSDRPILNDVSFEVRPGQVVGLVGATGAGKSTILSLISRFYDPDQGRVTFDGEDIRLRTLASVRSQAAMVLQDPFLLPLSVVQNIAYSRPGASLEEIKAAATAAEADGFVSRLPQGYDTVIGERGATLSGGERQRLAIARAFLRDAPILLLDEPTSALDVGTETRLLTAFERLMKGRTTLVVAHRLSTIRHADRIIVLDHGRVVEQGTHEDLVRMGGHYAALFSAQISTRQEACLA